MQTITLNNISYPITWTDKNGYSHIKYTGRIEDAPSEFLYKNEKGTVHVTAIAQTKTDAALVYFVDEHSGKDIAQAATLEEAIKFLS